MILRPFVAARGVGVNGGYSVIRSARYCGTDTCDQLTLDPDHMPSRVKGGRKTDGRGSVLADVLPATCQNLDNLTDGVGNNFG